MDFGFSQQEESFRKEVREFIQKEFPPELRWHFRATLAASIHGLDGEAWEFMKTMKRKLGWLTHPPRDSAGKQSSGRSATGLASHLR